MSALPVTLALLSLVAAAPIEEVSHRPEDTRYPHRAHCGVDLIEVGKHLGLFLLARDGQFPDKLSDAIADRSGGTLRCLICPAAPPSAAEGGFYPSYSYVLVTPGGRTDKDDPQDFVAFDAAPVHENGRNVLLADLATVRYLDEAEFQKQFGEQRARWEKQGKKLEMVSQDFIPLTDAQARDLQPAGRSFLDSVHFRLAVALVLAIAVVVVLLLRARARRAPAHPRDNA